MALEDLTGSGKYIDDLVSSNPAAGDNVSEGDDHIRGIKNVLKLSFPAITGAVTPTHTELNYVDGVTSAIQTQLNAITADDWVTGARVADDAIDSQHYADGSIDTAHIGDNQVTAAKVAADVATQAELDTVSTVASAALPKAGGTMTGDLILGDNVKVEVGSASGGDLEIYHDGSHTRMQNNTGNLNVRTGVFNVTNVADNETLLNAADGGGVDLYYNNALKLNTTSSGGNLAGNWSVGSNLFTPVVGRDTSDFIEFTDNANIKFTVNGGEETRLEADGDLHVDGDVIAISTTISDAALKYDINPVDHALEKINQLKGVSYKYKHNDRESAGLLAQDVEKVMPSAVKTRKVPLVTGDDKEYKTLHYDSMTAILVEAIKELTAKVKKLENR